MRLVRGCGQSFGRMQIFGVLYRCHMHVRDVNGPEPKTAQGLVGLLSNTSGPDLFRSRPFFLSVGFPQLVGLLHRRSNARLVFGLEGSLSWPKWQRPRLDQVRPLHQQTPTVPGRYREPLPISRFAQALARVN